MDTLTRTPKPRTSALKRQPRRVTLPAVVGIALLAIVGFAGYLMWRAISSAIDAVPTVADIEAAFAPEPYEEIGPVVVTAIWELGELTTVEMIEHTYIEKGTDGGWLQWARGDSLSMFVVAEIGAGVDLTSLTMSDFEVSEDGVVSLELPRAEVHYTAVDNEATVVIDREVGLFTKGDPNLETDARRAAETVLLDQALAAGILEHAEANAVKVLTNFLMGLGYSEVEISFVDSTE
ncbi:MAG: DUF4230 domain-containing protein [Acidimicrobiia bacterium]|nr:DUF4230 domain-containing protein [Acidimicrobiia bacterium]